MNECSQPSEPRSDEEFSLAEISVYPLKGAGAIRPTSWRLDLAGLRGDRSWMLIDAAGQCVTQLSTPRVALISASYDGDGIVFSAPGADPIFFDVESDSSAESVAVLMEEGAKSAAAVTEARFDAWFSDALGLECRLVRSPPRTDRWVDGNVDAGSPLRFQKAFPLHLTAGASLDDLNARLAHPVEMDRFRPNLTVDGTAPHEDDTWKRIGIGETILRVERACDHRCGVPNIDQGTGTRGVEPLKTLATYRRSSRGIYFGQNVTIERGGTINVGDVVRVLELGEGLTKREPRARPDDAGSGVLDGTPE